MSETLSSDARRAQALGRKAIDPARSGLAIQIEVAPIERIPGDLVVIGLCKEDCARPLKGPAARADWRTCGLLGERIANGRFTGSPEDVLLVAARGLAARRLLVIGLGPRDGYGATRCSAASAGALARARELGAEQVVFATPGVAPDDFARHASAVVSAAEEVLRTAGGTLVLRIPVENRERGRSEAALVELEAQGRLQLLRAASPASGGRGPAHGPAPS